jgi:hypothetical protein
MKKMKRKNFRERQGAMTDAADDVELNPRLCRLEGHGGDARSLLIYFFEKQNSFYSSSRTLADATDRLRASVNYIPDHYIEKFVGIMRREPFAFRIVTQLLCQPDEVARTKDAAEFLEEIFARFPE